MNPGEFILNADAGINCDKAGEFAAGFLSRLTGLKIGEQAEIHLSLDSVIQHTEGYRLTIAPAGIDLCAKTPAGLLYGAETLRQLLPPETEKDGIRGETPLPCLEIEDEPRFSYRGFMLDVSRHFFAVDEIKRMLDLIAMLKFNRFHWHLTDAQGWRIESDKFPKLTEIGSKRRSTLVYGWMWGKKRVNHKEYGGYYTKEQIREVVRYAKERGIEVIPEIDLPGHVTALLASYPELSCTERPIETATGEKREFDLVCAGKESVYSMLYELFDEVMELFPYRHIHIGGDEVMKKQWKKCPRCQAKIKELGLKNEKALQGYFMNRLAAHLQSKGCTIICWNDGLDETTQKDILCEYWVYLNKKETIRQINNGRKTIYAYINGYYLDYSYKNFGLKNSYNAGTGEKELTEEGLKNIIGVEAPLWSEMVYSRERADWQMFPRLLAIAESAWTAPEQKDYDSFLKRVFAWEKRLDAMGVQYTARECYLKKQQTGLIGYLDVFRPGDHPAMREYRKYNRVEGYTKR